jgi:SMC interacting uncharacterized protein involved in chromosome segregation
MKKDESKKKNDEFLKSCALQVIDMERSLISLLGDDGKDALEDLDELLARIENYDEKKDFDDGKGTLIQRMSIIKPTQQQTLPKKNLSPERAVMFAFKSLKSSIEYFEDEREIFVSKQEKLKQGSIQLKKAFDQNVKELTENYQNVSDERDALQQKCERLQRVDDRLEEVEDERNRLEDQVQNFEEMIAELESEKEILQLESIAANEAQNSNGVELRESSSNDDSYFGGIDAAMLHNQIESLEAQNTELNIQCDQHKATISSLLKKNKLNMFDTGFGGKANDFKAEENEQRLEELEAEYHKSVAQVKYQERQLEKKEQVAESMDNYIKEDTVKIKALEDAMQAMGAERSNLLSRIQDMEDEMQMLQFKCQAQQDAIVTVKKDSRVLKTFSRLDPGVMSAEQLEALEDDRERLTARCSSLEAQIQILEKELKDQNSVLGHMEKFSMTVANERNNLDYQVK